jgi:hypothetical protein
MLIRQLGEHPDNLFPRRGLTSLQTIHSPLLCDVRCLNVRIEEWIENREEIGFMNEISQLLEQRFGLSTDQAQQAESAILDLVKAKVPPQFQGIFDSVLGLSQNANQTDAGANIAPGGLGGLLGEAESLFGAQKS